MTTDTAHTFKKRFFIQKICIAVGSLFILIGAIGLLYPEFAGGHFSYSMNILHIASGLATLAAGTAKKEIYAYWVSIVGFLFTGLLALCGFLGGSLGFPKVGFEGQDPLHLVIVPKMIELGIVDHFINLFLAVIFAIGIVYYKKRTMNHLNNQRLIPQEHN